MTLAVRPVPGFEAYRFGMVAADPDGRVIDFEEKPRRTRSTLASMGIYVFRREVLVECLTAGAGKRAHDLGRDVIPALVRRPRSTPTQFHGYWADVGTVQAYYEANMALLAETPALDLYDPEWAIYTRSEERPAVLLGAEARVAGQPAVRRLPHRGHGHPLDHLAGRLRGAGRDGARFHRDDRRHDRGRRGGGSGHPGQAGARSAPGAKVGWGDDNTPNRKWPERLNTGLTLVGKDAAVPAGHTLGRNVVIYPKVTAKDYAGGRNSEWGDSQRMRSSTMKSRSVNPRFRWTSESA